jgi:hypothetical protein
MIQNVAKALAKLVCSSSIRESPLSFSEILQSLLVRKGGGWHEIRERVDYLRLD